MRKVAKVMVGLLFIVALLMGCGYPTEHAQENEQLRQEVETILTKYFLINGTPEEWDNMEPITDEQVGNIQDYIQRLVPNNGEYETDRR